MANNLEILVESNSVQNTLAEDTSEQEKEIQLQAIAKEILMHSDVEAIGFEKGEKHYCFLLRYNILLHYYEEFAIYPMISFTKYFLDPADPLTVLNDVYEMFIKSKISKEEMRRKREIQLRLTYMDGISEKELGMENFDALVPLTKSEDKESQVDFKSVLKNFSALIKSAN